MHVELRKVHNVLVEKSWRQKTSWETGCIRDGTVKSDTDILNAFSGSKWGPPVGSYLQGNETSGSNEVREYLDLVHDSCFVRNGCIAWFYTMSSVLFYYLTINIIAVKVAAGRQCVSIKLIFFMILDFNICDCRRAYRQLCEMWVIWVMRLSIACIYECTLCVRAAKSETDSAPYRDMFLLTLYTPRSTLQLSDPEL